MSKIKEYIQSQMSDEELLKYGDDIDGFVRDCINQCEDCELWFHEKDLLTWFSHDEHCGDEAVCTKCYQYREEERGHND